MESEIFFRKRNYFEKELINYAVNHEHDHHHGFMHVKYDEFYRAITEYKMLLFLNESPFKNEAKEEVKKFLEEQVISKLNNEGCEKCKSIASRIESECMPR